LYEDGKVIFSNVTIKLETVVNGEDTGAFDAIVQKFILLYDGQISVNNTHTGADTYEDTVVAKISNNNNPPDLIMSHQKSHRNFADYGFIQPLDEAMEKSGIQIDMSNYATGLAQYTKHGTNNLYSVPIDAQTQVVFYNKKELAKTGMTLPTNRTELVNVCNAYKTTTGNMPIAWSTSASYFSNYVYLTSLMQNGLKLYDETSFMTDWYDSEANRTAIVNGNESIRELINSGYAAYNVAGATNLSNFLKGKTLFYFTDPWTMESLVNAYAEQEGCSTEDIIAEYLGGAASSGWFAMTDNAQKNAIFGDSHFFAMTKSVTDINKKAAILEFIKWFTTYATAGADWAQAGHISVSQEILKSDKYKTNPYVVNLVNNFYGDINNFTCVGSTPYYDVIIGNLQSLFADAVNNKTLVAGYNKENDFGFIKGKQDAVNNQIAFFG
jgi:ABC-type glycerol-3-phosphate transport system substrate-binding protein